MITKGKGAQLTNYLLNLGDGDLDKGIMTFITEDKAEVVENYLVSLSGSTIEDALRMLLHDPDYAYLYANDTEEFVFCIANAASTTVERYNTSHLLEAVREIVIRVGHIDSCWDHEVYRSN
jgi:hypothetical protein